VKNVMISGFIVLSSTYSFIFIDCLRLYCYVCVILYSAIQLFSLQVWLNFQFSSVQKCYILHNWTTVPVTTPNFQQN